MNLKLHELKTAALFCASDETRLAICGVRFIHPGRLISTDGRILVAIETEAENEPSKSESFTLKASVIARLPLEKRTGISVLRESNDAIIRIPSEEVEYRFNDAFIEMDYPNYHRVLTEDRTSESVPVNGSFFAKIERAAELFSDGGYNPVIWSHGPFSPLEFFVGSMPNFYGVLMPMRKDQVEADNPLSLKLKAEKKTK